MEAVITVEQLLKIIASIGAIWAFVKVVKEIVDHLNVRHDQMQNGMNMTKRLRK